MIGFESAPRYREAVRRLFGDEELVPPGIVLEDDRPEWSYVKREARWARFFQSPAVAAQFGVVIIQNPLKTNVLATISTVLLIAPAGFSLRGIVSTTLSVPTTPLVAIPMDSRLKPASSSLVVFITSNAGGAGGTVGPVIAAPAVPFTEAITLAPGSQLQLFGTIVNTAFDVDVIWRERPAVAEELAD